VRQLVGRWRNITGEPDAASATLMAERDIPMTNMPTTAAELTSTCELSPWSRTTGFELADRYRHPTRFTRDVSTRIATAACVPTSLDTFRMGGAY
jgi:hypothetical protein